MSHREIKKITTTPVRRFLELYLAEDLCDFFDEADVSIEELTAAVMHAIAVGISEKLANELGEATTLDCDDFKVWYKFKFPPGVMLASITLQDRALTC